MKRAAFVGFLSFMALMLSGCWDRTEVNDLTLITAAAIDKADDKKIELSVQLFVPKQAGAGMEQMGGGGGGGGGKTLVRSAEGLTIADAMSKLQEKLPRRIFWGHDEIFIFGEKLAQEGIRPHVDFLMRHPQIRDRAYVLVSRKDAKSVLELQPPIERSSSEVLREMATSKTGLGVTLKEIDQMLSSDARAAALSWVEILPPSESGAGDKKSTIPYIAGTAVFKKDKMIGRLDDEATRGVLWLTNKIKTATATIKTNELDGLISMLLLRAHTDLIPKIENGKWKIVVKSTTEDDVVQNTTDLQIMKPAVSKMLEHELGKDVERLVRNCLQQLQRKMKADIVGFGEAFHRKYPREWNSVKDRWDEVFPSVEVDFDVKAYVRRPGGITGPAGLPEDEVKE